MKSIKFKTLLGKSLLLSFLVIVLISLIFRLMPKNDTPFEKLLIKSIIGYTFTIKNGVQEKSGYKSSLELFNKDQIQTLSEKYFKSGALEVKSFFDEDGLLIREVFYYEDGKVNYEYRYFRDENNKVINKMMFLGSGEKWSSIASEYDSDEKKIIDKYIDSEGKVIREDLYEYKNNLLITINCGKMGLENYEYNNLNQLTKKTIINPSGNVLGENYLYSYNGKGLLEKTIKEKEYVIEYKYAFFGNIK